MSVRVHITDRFGGVSAPPYAELNLGDHVGDDPAAVAENRRRLADRLHVERVVFMRQVHGSAVGRVDATSVDDVADVDVLVTDDPDIAVAVLVADCVPIALASAGAIAVAHAGRNGVSAGVVAAAVQALRSMSDAPLQATVGPAICGRCYEVPAQMQEEVARRFPVARSITRSGTPALDLPAAVRLELARLGVAVDPTQWPCTFESPAYYSHRRDGVTGRFALVARAS